MVEVLVIIAIIVWFIYRQANSSVPEEKQQAEFEEHGEPLFEFDVKEEGRVPVTKNQPKRKQTSKHRHKSSKQDSDQVVQETSSPSVHQEVNLRSPSEARKAFIYSEIFKRKY